jgi:hypothetical protein
MPIDKRCLLAKRRNLDGDLNDVDKIEHPPEAINWRSCAIKNTENNSPKEG